MADELHPDNQATVHVPKAAKRILTGLIMSSTLMVALDATIANVALPHMQAALGASPDSIAWVLTSYILASAVATPMTGWLSGWIGRKQLFTFSILGFTIASILCGLAASLPMMVVARFIQGAFGAFIMPSAQAVMFDMNSRKDQPRALTIWGIGIMVGPVMGPVLGGFLTDMFDWRWVFFINVPIGLLSALGMWTLMPSFPDIKRAFDKIGFVLVVVGLGALQLILDRGTSQDWFESPEIIIEAGLSIGCLWMLVFHLRQSPHPIIPLGLFRNGNFVMSLIFIFFAGAVGSAGSVLLSPMLQTLMGYSVLESGLMMMPRGLAMIAAMQMAGYLLTRIDHRFLVGGGLLITGSALWVMTGFTLEMGPDSIRNTGILLGIGMGLMSMPINLLSVSTLSATERTDGAAVFSLVRALGGSIVISITSALLSRNLQVNHQELGGSLTRIDLPFLIPGFTETMGIDGSSLLSFVDAEVNRQAMMIAYIDDYWIMMVAMFALLPLVLIVRPAKSSGSKPPPAHD